MPVNFYAIEFTSAVLLASNLASKILSAGSLVKVGGAASGGVLAGLPWLSVPGRDWWELAWGLGRAQGPAQGPMGGDNSITFSLSPSPVLPLGCPPWLSLCEGSEGGRSLGTGDLGALPSPS